MIKIKTSRFKSEPIPYEHFFFPGGEQHIKLDVKKLYAELRNVDEVQYISVVWNYENDAEMMKLYLIVDALRREMKQVRVFDVNVPSLILSVPYFPGARQDRVCDDGEPLSVEVYARMINSLGFDMVVIYDPHSDVAPALIDNVQIEDNFKLVEFSIDDIFRRNEIRLEDVVLISPDAGSNKKIFKIAKGLNGKYPVVRADKIRNVKTGEIEQTDVMVDDLTGKTAIIVDDICSRGGTFRFLSKELKKKNADKVFLIVSHFEGTANLRDMKESGIDNIYTTDSKPWNVNDYNKDHYIFSRYIENLTGY